MKTEDKVILAAAAIAAGYLIYRNLFPTWDTATGQQAAESAGFQIGYSTLNPGATTITGSKDTFLLREGDWGKLNLAQRTLITLDKIVPGTWLSRMALR